MDRRFRSSLCLAGLVIVGVAVAAGRSEIAPTASTWTLSAKYSGPCAAVGSVVSSPHLRGGELQAVAADASDDAWAVGGPSLFQAGKRPTALIEHWDGTRWAVVPSPAVAGVLESVAIAAPDDVWAVGELGTSSPGKVRGASGRGVALAEHWDGAHWVRVRFHGLRRLSAVAATSARDVWMVGSGSAGSAGPAAAAVILHWDGERWTRNRRPSVELLSLSALSPTDVWAVGDTSGGRFLEMHWDGRRWSSYTERAPNTKDGPDENPELTSVVASGSRDLWAGGDAGQSGEPAYPDTVLFHWDGTRWRKAPIQGNQWIYALTLRAPGDLWIASGYGTGDAYSVPILEERAPKWPGIDLGHGQIDGLSSDRTDGLWAVGFTGSRFDENLQYPHRTYPLIERVRCA